MLDGELYKAWNEELTAMRDEARQLNGRYNTLMGASLEGRNAILRLLLGRCSSIDIQPAFFCDYRVHIFTGKTFL
jgi:maltose O-acetyltransferase